MKLKISHLILFTLIVNIFFANATRRFVSKTGTSTPPFTSWETAADSIQKCIDICSFGDTVYVGVGTYTEKVMVNRAITLIGISIDSVKINGANAQPLGVVEFSSNAKIENFTVVGNGTSAPAGIYTFNANIIVRNCRVNNIAYGIVISRSSSLVENCIISNCSEVLIRDECGPDTCHSIYRNNIILSSSASIAADFSFGGTPTFTDNILIEEGGTLTGIETAFLRGIILKNNFVAGYNWNGMLITYIQTDTAYIIQNNLVYNPIDTMFGYGAIAIGTGHRTQIKNNILTNSNRGIYGYQSNDSTKADYNLFWNVANIVAGNASLGDSNIVADPIFVKDTIPTANGNCDFHLQAYSPAIDKGDPSIQDVDGSRSDISMYGGPDGEKYIYLDLPPKTRRNFSYSFDSTNTFLTLKWDMNYESDFKNYKIYRDTIAGFIPNQFNLIGETDTSMIVENISEINSSKIYYRVSVVDNQDNESQPGNEIAVTITGIEPGVTILREYILYQNYPNPFNPSTTIGYEIKERAYVKLMVYDIKGELVTVLVNKEQNAGYYEVEFSSPGNQYPVSKVSHLGFIYIESK